MQLVFRYTLERGSKKYICPECNKKSFVFYIDNETGNYLPNEYGRCDRESKCSYHLNPYNTGFAEAINKQEYTSNFKNYSSKKAAKQSLKPESIPFDFETFKLTLQNSRYEKNTFIQNLLQRVPFPFEIDRVTKVVEIYRLGTVSNGYRAGAITFPYIDINQTVRAIQVKEFNEQNHTTSTDFLHTIIEKDLTKRNKPFPQWLTDYLEQEKRITCLFGEHLLKMYPNNPIALVEAPKTAIYGTLYFGHPETERDLIWLAVYNKSSFSFERLSILKGRFVYVFPDLSKEGNTFKEWEMKAKEYENRLPNTRFTFSNLLERSASTQDREQGKDIADYLIQLDWRLFKKKNNNGEKWQKVANFKANTIEEKEPEQVSIILPTETIHPDSYTKELNELENFFNTTELPTQEIRLNKHTKITDSNLFVKSHLYQAETAFKATQRVFFLENLKQFKDIIYSLP